MLNYGVLKFDAEPVCAFEESLHSVKTPGKTLNTIGETSATGMKIVQKNCQSWIIESADQLVRDSLSLYYTS